MFHNGYLKGPRYDSELYPVRQYLLIVKDKSLD